MVKECNERKVSTMWDSIAWLVEKALLHEKSSYKRLRAVMLREAEKKGWSEQIEMIRISPRTAKCVKY